MIKGKYGLRKLIVKQGYPMEVIDVLNSFLKDLNIEIVSDHFEYDEYFQIIKEFKLLPNDARSINLSAPWYRHHLNFR